MTIGIYSLKFNNTNKRYIGLSINIEHRFKQHIASFKTEDTSTKLLEAYKLYGQPTLEVIAECTEEELEYLEIEAILIYDSINNGFNSVSGGSKGCGLSGELNGASKYSNQQVKDYMQEQYCALVNSQDRRSIANKLSATKRDAKSVGIIYPRLVDPDGRVHEVTCLSKFSKANSLTSSALCRVLKGKSTQHKGWRVYNESK